MIAYQIKENLTLILKDLGVEPLDIKIDYPQEPKNGDYASNVALVVSKKLGKNPMELAEKIADELRLKNKDLQLFEKVEVAKPGFINFWIKDEYLIKNLDHTKNIEKGHLLGKKIMVEFTDPNPFKEFHIGHLYSNIIGESISRLLESQGAEVWRVCYQGDVGMHVAKSIWGLQKKIKDQGIKIEDLEKKSWQERAKFLGESYALGAEKYESGENAKEEIVALNKAIYEKDTSIVELYEKGKKWSLDYFEQIYKRLGTEFKRYYFESEVGEYGIKYVKENVGKVFKESEGAIVFPGEDYGLHTRVFINSKGLPTYEAKELGLAPTKYKDYKYDQSIIVTGNEINEYFKVLLKALSLINPDLASKTKHLPHGMVRLPEGKMSSRTGDVITGEWLLDTAKKEALKLSPDVKTAELVGIGAVKYALLKSSIGSDIVFDFEESVSFEGSSGPYIQYVFARTQSVLERVKNKEKRFTLNASPLTLEPEERDLLVLLARFDEIIEAAVSRFSPNIIATYLFELSQAFNLFYQLQPILKSEGQVRDFRLNLTESTGKTIKKGLKLLGINAPVQM